MLGNQRAEDRENPAFANESLDRRSGSLKRGQGPRVLGIGKAGGDDNHLEWGKKGASQDAGRNELIAGPQLLKQFLE